MISRTPFPSSHAVMADTSRSLLETLGIIAAVIGVLLWVGGLAWLVLRDVIHAVEHSHHRDDDSDHVR